MSYDAIIIGAGPAGSAAAIDLSNAGARVLLVDRDAFPREKACGDGLFPRAVEIARDLGVEFADAPRISRLVARSTDGRGSAAFRLRNDDFATVVPRRHFDFALVRAAVAAGADFRESTSAELLVVEGGAVHGVVTRTRSGAKETARAPVTILAEGSVAGLRRQAPVPVVHGTHMCFASRRYWQGVEFDESSYAFEMHFPMESDGIPIVGYGWVFPVGDGLANVGAGYFSRGQNVPSLNALLHRFEVGLVEHDDRFACSEPIDRPLGAPIRVGGSGASSHGPGILLVGDSAGVAHPFTGEGISQALSTGRMASSSVLAHLDRGVDLSAYGSALASWNRSYDRMSNRLSLAHRSTGHLARDIVPMFRGTSSVARSVFRMLESEVQNPKPSSQITAGCSVAALAKRATDRAIETATRERPFYSDLIFEMLSLDDAPLPLAVPFYAARVAIEGPDCLVAEDHRMARVLELLRIVTFAVDSVSLEHLSSDPESRGGDWLESYFTLGLADRVLARMFSTIGALGAATRKAVSEELVGVYRALTDAAMTGEPPSGEGRDGLLTAAAVRMGVFFSDGDIADHALSPIVSEYARGDLSTEQLVIEVRERQRR